MWYYYGRVAGSRDSAVRPSSRKVRIATPAETTGLLLRWSGGDADALDELVPIVYEELKRLARARLAHERSDNSLNTTGLVHEAYLRLVKVSQVEWRDRNHFFSMAARTMRRVLVDHARRRSARKRSPGSAAPGHQEPSIVPAHEIETLLALDDALRTLAQVHPRPGAVIEMYYFGGLTQQEIAEALSVSQATISTDLRFGRAVIARALEAELPPRLREDGLPELEA